jgi:hypothetical protein
VNARNRGRSRLDVGASGQFYEFPEEDFFGLGMDSVESNRTNYLLDAIESGVAVRWKPSRLQFGGGVAYFSPCVQLRRFLLVRRADRGENRPVRTVLRVRGRTLSRIRLAVHRTPLPPSMARTRVPKSRMSGKIASRAGTG